MKVVNVHEAKTSFSKLLDRAHRGEEIILAKSGKPWARLMPLAQRAPREPGRYSIRSGEAAFEPLDEDELKGWEGS